MKEMDELKRWIEGCNASYKQRMAKLEKGIEKTKTKRQEQTGKPYHRD